MMIEVPVYSKNTCSKHRLKLHPQLPVAAILHYILNIIKPDFIEDATDSGKFVSFFITKN